MKERYIGCDSDNNVFECVVVYVEKEFEEINLTECIGE